MTIRETGQTINTFSVAEFLHSYEYNFSEIIIVMQTSLSIVKPNESNFDKFNSVCRIGFVCCFMIVINSPHIIHIHIVIHIHYIPL